ncbi:MAG TPA: hypothetical protein PKL65_09640 [Bacteroidales bacterium]|jgi:hypothetical protein|nr:hypothetical protein [Bacteroidales bacterium]HNR42484.1 hypothetical protein [Bacteroidales bacterium]HPM19235.1 hypothetical protein [Bacteroidales bacterium]HQG76354.1 hypothetical protein [Bacteroidales bacterium]
MKNKVLFGFATILMVAFLAGCGKVPQVEIDAAKAAIEAAKAAEADVYIPVELAAVQDSMNAVLANVEAQKSKLFKKFGPAKEKLAAVVAMANQAAANAAVKKEEVRKESEKLLNDIKAVTEENGKLILKAPRGKEGAAVIEQIKADMAAIDATVAEAQDFFNKGAFMNALNKIKAAKEKADGINTELKEAIAKVRR